MTRSQNIPNCFDCNCRIPNHSGVHTGAFAQANSPQQVRNIVIVHRCVGRWIKLVQSDSTASSQGITCGSRAETIDLAG